jgi:hypothetical protein
MSGNSFGYCRFACARKTNKYNSIFDDVIFFTSRNKLILHIIFFLDENYEKKNCFFAKLLNS